MKIHRSVLPLLALLHAGCAAQPYYRLPPAAAGSAAFAAAGDEGLLVGLAISGGGSRSATFTAAVLEELAKIPLPGNGADPKSLLESVGYISSVSGGSLAATYFGMRKPGSGVRVLDASGLSPQYREFFRDFSASMQGDFEGSLIRGVLVDRDWGVNSIAGIWDQAMFHGATFSDLNERERRGDSPTLILNATNLDDGRRFLFTTLPQRAFQFNVAHEIAARLTSTAVPQESLRAMRRQIDDAAADEVPVTFDGISADPGGFRLSLAVAGSSAVPYIIGPLVLGSAVDGHERLYHLADGGLADNQGLESLFQLFAGKLRPGGPSAAGRRGLIIAIDATFPVMAATETLPGSESLLQSLTRNPLRLTAIMERSGRTYRLLLWSVLQGTGIGTLGIIPGFEDLRIVSLRHVDADQALARTPPAECAGTIDRPTAPEKMHERLARIATRYEISNPCDVALLRAAARVVVGDNAVRIIEFFRQGS